MMYTGLTLFADIPTRRKLTGGLVYGMSIPVVRHFVGIGPHIFVLVTCYLLIAHFVVRASWLAAICAAILGFGLIYFGDMMLVYPGILLLGIPIERVFDTGSVAVLVGWISALPLASAALAVKLFRLRLFSV